MDGLSMMRRGLLISAEISMPGGKPIAQNFLSLNNSCEHISQH